MASVTRQRKSPRPRRAATETAVFDAVERLLDGGARYTELGVEQISVGAGIGRSTFYVHFADKTDLLVRLVRARTADLFGAADRWLATDPDAGWEGLRDVLAEVCRQRRAQAAAINALAEVATYDRDVAGFWRGQVTGFADRLARRLAADKRRGLTVPDLDPASTATFVTWGVERALEQQTLTRSPRTDRRLVDAMARGIWSAFYGAP